MRTKRHLIMWILPVLLAAVPTAVYAQAPLGTDFSYQGQLKVAGAPLEGTADFEFTFWDDPEAGSQVGDTVPVDDVAIADGLFTVALDFGVEVFNGEARWLEIAVRSPAGEGEFSTLSPRQPLSAAPYSLQTRGMYCDAGGQVGIGTTAPAAKLDVDAGALVGMQLGSAGYGAMIEYERNNGDYSFYTGIPNEINSTWEIQNIDHTPLLSVRYFGNVGIGTTSPTARLDVATPGDVPSIVTRGGADYATVAGQWMNFGHWDGTTFQGHVNITSDGYVGIGQVAPMPTAPLHVVGSNAYPHLRVQADAAAPYGAFFSLDATETDGGKEYLIGATGGSAAEGTGKLIIQNQTDGVRAMVVDESGKVGIGSTVTPTAPLTVVRPVGGAVVARFLDQDAATSALDIRATSLRGEIQCTSEGDPADLALNPDGGNVGIGTIGPSHRLTIVSPDNDTLRLIGPGSWGSTARLNFGDADYVYIDEDVDDHLRISAFGGITLDAPSVEVTGTLSKAGGSFKIDHPLDPEHKYLYHSFVESPDMMNVYNGNIVTDADGFAVVTLPDWFEALNRDFRYQLTVIGQFAQAIVAKEIQDNAFVIQTDRPGVKVSWQVTGIRQDAWAEANRIPVEVDKPADEWGQYLHPEAFGIETEQGRGRDAKFSTTSDSEAYDQ